ncbi:S41 family peptidase [Azospirillum sp. sgz302134]
MTLLLLAASVATCAVVPAARPEAGPALERYREAFAALRPGAIPPSPADPNYALFTDVLRLVVTSYVTPTDPQRLVDKAIEGLRAKNRNDPGAGEHALTVGAIEAMLAPLDPYTAFLDAEHVRDVREQMHGEFPGLGIEVATDRETGLLRVVASHDDTPAAHAGVQSGDLITAIDGREIKGLSLPDAVAALRGPAGGAVNLQLLHRDGDAPVRVSVTRAVVHFQPVVSWLDGDVAYVRVVYFSEQAARRLHDALESQWRGSGGRLAGVVLDLRDNPGGLFDQGIKVAAEFLGPVEIVSTRSRDFGERHLYGNSDSGGDAMPSLPMPSLPMPSLPMPNLPMVVLIDGGSSSSAEVVAGALQDHHRALLFGARSYGKGSVQSIFVLPGGEGLRLTTAHFFRPSGARVDCFGVLPDLEILPAERPRIPEGLPEDEEVRRDPATCDHRDAAPVPPKARTMAALCPELSGRLLSERMLSGKLLSGRLPGRGVDGPLECAFAALRAGRVGVGIGGP